MSNLPSMRAKMRINNIIRHSEESEEIYFMAVAKDEGYDESGIDENNTFARWTPSAEMHMNIVNPALCGVYEIGDEFYLDFTLAAAAPREEVGTAPVAPADANQTPGPAMAGTDEEESE